jgi:hypothetical protein
MIHLSPDQFTICILFIFYQNRYNLYIGGFHLKIICLKIIKFMRDKAIQYIENKKEKREKNIDIIQLKDETQ